MRKLISRTIAIYSRCDVAQSAAALSYYLLLTIFPLLLAVNHIIGIFHMDLEGALKSVERFLPAAALGMVTDYLNYASQNQSLPLVLTAVFTILLSASAGIRTLLGAMDRLYRLPPNRGLGRLALSVALSVFFLATLYLSVAVLFTGEWLLRALQRVLPRELQRLLPLEALFGLWGWLRYFSLFFLVLLLVLAVYRAGTPRGAVSPRQLRLSALFTASAMVLSSALFSWFISQATRYSLLYGSLASLVVVLVWLYFCGNVLLIGAVVSRAWLERESP